MRSDEQITERINLMKKREIPTWVLGNRLNHDAITEDLLDFTAWLLEIE